MNHKSLITSRWEVAYSLTIPGSQPNTGDKSEIAFIWHIIDSVHQSTDLNDNITTCDSLHFTVMSIKKAFCAICSVYNKQYCAGVAVVILYRTT